MIELKKESVKLKICFLLQKVQSIFLNLFITVIVHNTL